MPRVAAELPDDLARHLEAGGKDLSRRTLEALVVDAYRDGEITAADVRRILQLPSRWAADEFLKKRGGYLDYSEADLEADLELLRRAAPDFSLSGRSCQGRLPGADRAYGARSPP